MYTGCGLLYSLSNTDLLSNTTPNPWQQPTQPRSHKTYDLEGLQKIISMALGKADVS